MKKHLLSLLFLFLSVFLSAQSVEITKSSSIIQDTLLVSISLQNNTGGDLALGNSKLVLGVNVNALDILNARVVDNYYTSNATLLAAYVPLSLTNSLDTLGFSLNLELHPSLMVTDLPPSDAIILDG